MLYVSVTRRCLFSDKYKTHKYSVGRAYSCWMLNCWCITWPVGFKNHRFENSRHFQSIMYELLITSHDSDDSHSGTVEYSSLLRCHTVSLGGNSWRTGRVVPFMFKQPSFQTSHRRTQCTSSDDLYFNDVKFMLSSVHLNISFRESTALEDLVLPYKIRLDADKPHSVRLLWTSDQPDALTSTWQHAQHSQETNIHTHSEIRTSKRGAVRHKS